MNFNKEQTRKEQLIKCIPDIFEAESLLYVGGHFHFGRDLQMTRFFKCPIDVVEVWPENVRDMTGDPRLRHVFLCDIRDFDSIYPYDVTMFWHGPEHLRIYEMRELIDKMKKYTKKYIVFATPNGIYEQGPEYGNPYERHKTHWTKEAFEFLGLKADAVGDKNKRNGNIIAWKTIE